MTGRRSRIKLPTPREAAVGIGRVLASVLTFGAFVMVPGGVLILLGMRR